MGLLSALTGAASETNVSDIEREVAPFLTQGETIVRAFKLVRDLYIFTDRRLILVDKMGITGKKQEWQFIPYKSIVRFSLETAGHFDADAELRVWVSGSHEPIKREFRKDAAVKDVCRLLSFFLHPAPAVPLVSNTPPPPSAPPPPLPAPRRGS